MTIRHRFSDFIESLKQPRRKFGAVCFLLAFVCVDFLLGGIYFLAGYFTLQNIGPAAEMAADLQDTYQISVTVDTSQYLWWCIPFFLLAAATAVFLIRYIVTQRHVLSRVPHAVRTKERIRAKQDAVVAVRVHTVDPEKAKNADLRKAPPAWLLDPLAVVAETKPEEKQETEKDRTEQDAQQPFTYSDFVKKPHAVSTPHNTVQRPTKQPTDIPYAGSLQYIPRKEKKNSPYDPMS